MYDELIKRLKNIANSDGNIKSNYIGLALLQAAGAIEELSMKLHGDEAAIAGMKREIERMVVAGKPHWIPVTERLPEEDTRCLVSIVGGEFGQLSWMSMAIFYNGVFRYNDHCGEFDQITHWMPLPEPPESEET